MIIRVDSNAEADREDNSGTEPPRACLPICWILHDAMDGDAGLAFLKGPVLHYGGLGEVALDNLAMKLEFGA